MIFTENENTFSFEVSSVKSEKEFNTGLWLVLIGINETPPHIALVYWGKYYSLSTGKVDCGTHVDRIINTIMRKNIPSVFVRVSENTMPIAGNEAASPNILLNSIFKDLKPLTGTEMTCLSPVREFFTACFSSEFIGVNYVFELLALAESKGLLKDCFSLFPLVAASNVITLPKYTMAQIRNTINEISTQRTTIQ